MSLKIQKPKHKIFTKGNPKLTLFYYYQQHLNRLLIPLNVNEVNFYLPYTKYVNINICAD